MDGLRGSAGASTRTVALAGLVCFAVACGGAEVPSNGDDNVEVRGTQGMCPPGFVQSSRTVRGRRCVRRQVRVPESLVNRTGTPCPPGTRAVRDDSRKYAYYCVHPPHDASALCSKDQVAIKLKGGGVRGEERARAAGP